MIINGVIKIEVFILNNIGKCFFNYFINSEYIEKMVTGNF